MACDPSSSSQWVATKDETPSENYPFSTASSITRCDKGRTALGNWVSNEIVTWPQSARSARRPDSTKMRAAVQLVILTCDESGARTGEKTHHLGDVLRRAPAANQGPGKRMMLRLGLARRPWHLH
jgi:hypothetical protein